MWYPRQHELISAGVKAGCEDTVRLARGRADFIFPIPLSLACIHASSSSLFASHFFSFVLLVHNVLYQTREYSCLQLRNTEDAMTNKHWLLALS
jgi:hypothetical protein